MYVYTYIYVYIYMIIYAFFMYRYIYIYNAENNHHKKNSKPPNSLAWLKYFRLKPYVSRRLPQNPSLSNGGRKARHHRHGIIGIPMVFP